MNEPISYLKSFNHNDKSFQKNAVAKRTGIPLYQVNALGVE